MFTSGAVVPDRSEADLVIGQQPANAANFDHPYVAVDPVTQKVFVGDYRRNRILRFGSAESLSNGAAAEAVLGQADFTSIEPGTGPEGLSYPTGLWCDASGRLWVCDAGNNRVLRFDTASTLASGAPANGVLGQVNFTNVAAGTSASTLFHPSGLVTDALGNLYVAEVGNRRVVRFNSAASLPNGASASAVLGQPNFTTADFGYHDAVHLNGPSAVAISPNPVLFTQPSLWVADTQNHRVLLYLDAPHISSGAAATRVLGQVNLTSSDQNVTARGTYYPHSLAADASGRLYVGSSAGNRVLRFDNATAKPNYAPADAVLGQVAFTTSAAGSGPGGVNTVPSLALGAGGMLWMADQNNHRVLRHEAAHTKVNGADADSVLGAPTTTTDLTRRFRPPGVAIDPVSGKLFVSDDQRNRVLRFASVSALTTGAGAEAVFGQANFSGKDAATAANRMANPGGLAVDSLGNLWVADTDNRRVLRFNNAATRLSGAAADGLVGQPDFTTNGGQLRSATNFGYTRSIATGPSGQLWVSDGTRVLRFDQAHTKGIGAPADGVLGQGNFTSTISGVVDAFHFSSYGIAVDESGRLWVNDATHHRLLRFDNAPAKINGAPADGVLGQDTFLTENNGGLGPDGISFGSLLTEPGGRLWLASGNEDRLVRWENAAKRPNGADADGVLGPPDFGFDSPGAGLGKFNYPIAIARDATGHLWIADEYNERIVRYSPQVPTLGIAPLNAATVRLTLDHHARGVTYSLQTSSDLQNWAPDGSFTASHQNPVFFDKPITPGGHGFFRFVELP